jgi:hypothetical protein
MGVVAYPGKLVIKWSNREGDLLYHYPSAPDGHFAHATLGTPLVEFLDEMEKRGYDRKSFRMSIRRKDQKP